MTAAELQLVRTVPLFVGLTDDQLDCLEAGTIVELPGGTVIAAEGERNGFFHIVLEGEVRITRNYDRQTILMKVGKPGTYFGEVMLFLDSAWVSTVRVTKAARLFRLDEEGFWHLLSKCRSVAHEVFQSAAVRLRNFEGYTQQREKLVSLGTMAAGLAHELNNPAAAARRAAAHLQENSDKMQGFLCELSMVLEAGQWQPLLNAEETAFKQIETLPVMDHLTRSDNEEAMTQWLESQGVVSAWNLAPTFVTAGLSPDWLAQVVAALPESSRADALNWLECRLNQKLLVGQVEQSTGRIVELVKAVKSYSFMDQSPKQEIDIHEGLESTLTMLGYKLKNVTLVRAYDRTLPRFMAYGSELNQVWTNLIDNAIDATGGKGKVCIGTTLDHDQIVVEIMDDGPGIPPEVQARMFEPFFTTKGVGAGTGLGLVISHRIVGARHGGEIEFESQPGKTMFKVRLPLEQPAQEP